MALFNFSNSKTQRIAGAKPLARASREEEEVPLVVPLGCAVVSDHIMHGARVGRMVRERCRNDADSGWIFMSGKETREFADNPSNWTLCALNTITSFDPSVLPYLRMPEGTALDRVPGTDRFIRVEAILERLPPGHEVLDPAFPIVEGDFAMCEHWSLRLPLPFNRRMDEDALLLWRPDLTAHIHVWNDPTAEHNRWQRFHALCGETPDDAFEAETTDEAGVLRRSYRRDMLRGEGLTHSLHAFAIGTTGRVRMTLRFDHEIDAALARHLWLGLRERA